MTRQEFMDIKPTVLGALRESPRKPDELIGELTDIGFEDTQIRNAVWWLIDEGMLRFSSGWKLEVIPQTDDAPVIN
ncbi:MAG: hypothetical protein OXC95_09085 [Dehalococcoidia bacterium]|nr:hypothetical protein [Dehalococcoidia bacterium]